MSLDTNLSLIMLTHPTRTDVIYFTGVKNVKDTEKSLVNPAMKPEKLNSLLNSLSNGKNFILSISFNFAFNCYFLSFDGSQVLIDPIFS